MSWPINAAKAKFSDLLACAESAGPQDITRHGTRRAVVLSASDYDALIARQPDFLSHLLGGPKVASFHVPRSRDLGRPVDL